MEIKAAHYSKKGSIIKLCIDGTFFLVQVFDKLDIKRFEISTSDYRYARRKFQQEIYNCG